MEFSIVKPEIDWKPGGVWVKLNRDSVVGITLHHMAHPTADLHTINKWHKNRWNNEPGIGYNYWIDFEGKIHECRGEYRGAHVANRNSSLIGIGFQGNYHPISGTTHREKMPDKQFNAGVWLIQQLQNMYPRARTVHGHKYWGQTACPGKYFPLVEMLTMSYRQEDVVKEGLEKLKEGNILNLPTVTLRKGDRGSQVTLLQKALLAVGEKLPRYGADNDFGAETEAAVKSFQKKHDLVQDGIAGSKTYSKLKEVLTPEKPKTIFELGGKKYEIREL